MDDECKGKKAINRGYISKVNLKILRLHLLLQHFQKRVDPIQTKPIRWITHVHRVSVRIEFALANLFTAVRKISGMGKNKYAL